jgi:hypothetical protein
MKPAKIIGNLRPSGEIPALRRVGVRGDDYAFQEYEFSGKHLAHLARKLAAKDAAAIKSGKLKPWKA